MGGVGRVGGGGLGRCCSRTGGRVWLGQQALPPAPMQAGHDPPPPAPMTTPQLLVFGSQQRRLPDFEAEWRQ